MQPDYIKTDISAGFERLIAMSVADAQRIAADPAEDPFMREQMELMMVMVPPAYRWLARRFEMNADPVGIANEAACTFAMVINGLAMTLAQSNDPKMGKLFGDMIGARLAQISEGNARKLHQHEASARRPGRA